MYTYEEAMKRVDAGRIMARESEWLAREAGFSWGPWVSLTRMPIEADHKRYEEYQRTFGWRRGEQGWIPTGPYVRTYHTLCESVRLVGDDDVSFSGFVEWEGTTDWLDVTDRFRGTMPKGWFEHMYPGKA